MIYCTEMLKGNFTIGYIAVQWATFVMYTSVVSYVLQDKSSPLQMLTYVGIMLFLVMVHLSEMNFSTLDMIKI